MSFLSVAKAIQPELMETVVRPSGFSTVVLNPGEETILDFGGHFVGYLTVNLGVSGAHPDAPAWIRIRFAEHKRELSENMDDYHGWISKAWIQQEDVRLDVLPCQLRLPRRYAFRYVSIKLMAAGGFGIRIEEAEARAVSSADDSKLKPLNSGNTEFDRLDEIACRTLHECMQSVFEDGPKRDRRLWLGDLRIQALANSMTYRNYELTKRCLYLFAACAREDGAVPASLYIEPEIEGADGVLFDYALLFVPTLREYFEASSDAKTLCDLWPTALTQIKWASKQFDERGIVRDPETITWCFGDWSLALNKQASAQGTYLYALKAALSLAEKMEDADAIHFLQAEYDSKLAASKKYLWDCQKGLFKSGRNCELSWPSQIWMALGGAVELSEIPALFERMEQECIHKPVTPYLYHYYLEALLSCGESEKALELIRTYWGGMVNAGADTFWEFYKPDDADFSPYGGSIVNSYCHAWSCSPAYFLRKMFK